MSRLSTQGKASPDICTCRRLAEVAENSIPERGNSLCFHIEAGTSTKESRPNCVVESHCGNCCRLHWPLIASICCTMLHRCAVSSHCCPKLSEEAPWPSMGKLCLMSLESCHFRAGASGDTCLMCGRPGLQWLQRFGRSDVFEPFHVRVCSIKLWRGLVCKASSTSKPSQFNHVSTSEQSPSIYRSPKGRLKGPKRRRKTIGSGDRGFPAWCFGLDELWLQSWDKS